MRLADRTVVVTGATGGIGRHIAVACGREGASVVVVGRNEARGAKVAAQVLSVGGQARFVRTDLTVEKDVALLYEITAAAFGTVDAVVINAAATDVVERDRPIAEQTTEDFSYFIDGCLYSAFWSYKYAIRYMLPRGGAFLSMSSVAAVVGRPRMPSYSAAKGALNALTRQVARDYGKLGIRSNGLVLGFTLTDRNERMLENAQLRASLEQAFLGSIPEASDVASVAVSLISDEARAVNGALLSVDGGVLANSALPAYDGSTLANLAWQPGQLAPAVALVRLRRELAISPAIPHVDGTALAPGRYSRDTVTAQRQGTPPPRRQILTNCDAQR